MARHMKSYQLHFDEHEHELFDLIEKARIMKGMTKKGFFLYAVANFIPELSTPIVKTLTSKPHSKNTKAIVEDRKNEPSFNHGS